MRRTAIFTIVASILAIMMWSGAAVAYETGIYEQGFLVPLATYDTSGTDTVVGIELGVNTGIVSGIYWNYMSINGVQLSAGSINIVSGTTTYPFSLSNKDAGAHPGVMGWLLFTWDDNGTLEGGDNANIVSGNSFLLDLTANDAAFIPIIPLDFSDYQGLPIPLNNVPSTVLGVLTYGVFALNSEMSVRFTNQDDIGSSTTLYIFTPLQAPATFEAIANGDNGLQTSTFNIPSSGTRLNSVDLSTITELSGIDNGSITITQPAGSPIGIAFGLSTSSVLGAAQTTVVTAF